MRDRRTPYLLLAVLVAGVGLAIGLGLSEAPTGPVGAWAVGAVANGLRATEAAGSAAVTIGSELRVGSGRPAGFTGSGVIDFRSGGDEELTMRLAVGPIRVSITVLQVGAAEYLSLKLPGKGLGALAPGKRWIVVRSGKLERALAKGAQPSPGEEFSLLSAPGATVRWIGTSEVDGVATTGYAVTPSRAALRQNLGGGALSGLSPALRREIRNAAASVGTETVRLWFDGRGLMRRMSVGGALIMTFSHYGIPVHVAAPPRSQVISSGRLLRLLEGLALPLL